jgi:hypothetical protein
MDTFVCASNTNQTQYFFFEFKDEPWKDVLYGGVEVRGSLTYALQPTEYLTFYRVGGVSSILSEFKPIYCLYTPLIHIYLAKNSRMLLSRNVRTASLLVFSSMFC